MIARFEIAWIIENVVFRQKCFVREAEKFFVVDDSGAVVKATTIGIVGFSNRADDRRNPMASGNYSFEMIRGVFDYVRIEKPILRCVSMSRDLGKDYKIRAVGLCFFDAMQNLIDISFNVSVDCIDLCDGDFHCN